jgi:cohesin complex subunit SA-1/2
MMDATSLSNTNSIKVLELEEHLSTSLRDIIQGRDEIEIASFTEDEVLALTGVCTRLATLAGTRDVATWMEEDEGGKQSSAWDIIMALIERGKLGYIEEESVAPMFLAINEVNIDCSLDDRSSPPAADPLYHMESTWFDYRS